MKVLFVCSGNICRSPMAAALFAREAARAGLEGVWADSAGTLGIEKAPASPEAIGAMAEIGIDLSGHRSKGLGSDLVRDADWILAMTAEHLDFLHRKFPPGKGRSYLLRAFEATALPHPTPPGLDDPIGYPIELYREQRELMGSCVRHLVLYFGRHR